MLTNVKREWLESRDKLIVRGDASTTPLLWKSGSLDRIALYLTEHLIQKPVKEVEMENVLIHNKTLG